MHRVTIFTSLLLLFSLAGCDLFGAGKEEEEGPSAAERPSIEGHWYSLEIPAAGDCCGMSLDLREEEGEVTGSGVVRTPGSRVGQWDEYPVRVTGTYTGEGETLRLSLSLEAPRSEGTYAGGVGEDPFGLRVDGELVGFGEQETFLLRLED